MLLFSWFATLKAPGIEENLNVIEISLKDAHLVYRFCYQMGHALAGFYLKTKTLLEMLLHNLEIGWTKVWNRVFTWSKPVLWVPGHVQSVDTIKRLCGALKKRHTLVQQRSEKKSGCNLFEKFLDPTAPTVTAVDHSVPVKEPQEV